MKDYIKTGMLLTLLFFIQSCQSQPDTKSINKCIKHYYSELSNQDGSGTYGISEIRILKVIKLNKKRVWEVKVIVLGTYQNGSLPNDEGPRDYKEETVFLFKRNNATQWECSIKKDE